MGLSAITAINDAMKRARILDPEETISDAEANHNLGRLNDLLDFWSIKRLTVITRTEDIKVLTVSDGEYSIGTSGVPDINSVRPIKIEGAYLRDTAASNLDIELDCLTLTQSQYNAIPIKATTGQPSRLFYGPTVPNGSIKFNLLPDKAYELHAFSWKPFTAFANLTTEYDFAPGYSAAIKANLAILLADDHEAPITARMIHEAEETLSAIQTVNVEVPQIRSCGSAPGIRSSFDFRTGN